MKRLWFLLLLFLTACNTPRITSSWSPPEAKKADIKKVVVVGILPEEDSSLRYDMEIHMKNDLLKKGWNAVSFSESFNRKEFPPAMRYEDARSKLLAEGIDGVITITMLGKRTDVVQVKDEYHMSSETGSFWYYVQTIAEIINKDRTRTEKIATWSWETNLYDIKKQQLLYAAKSAFYKEKENRKIAHMYGRMLVKDMTNHRVH